MPRNRGQTRRGYLLLAVIIATVIAGMALVSVARQSLQLANEALREQTELQQRWGTTSLQRTLLPVAGDLFAARDLTFADQLRQRPGTPRPAALVEARIVLGGQPLEWRLADEDAKRNLNTLFEHDGRAAVEQVLRGTGGLQQGLPTRLIPAVTRQAIAAARDGDQPPPRAFGSWGEVFDLSRARPETTARWRLSRLTTGITCWGQGQLNVGRAGDAAIIDVCRLVVPGGRAQRLVDSLRKNPRQDIRRLIEQAVSDRQDQLQLESLLGRTSACYSLWVDASHKDGREQRLVVLIQDEEGGIRTEEFVF